MWVATGKNLQMTEGDYNVEIPIKIRGITLDALDSVKVTVKTAKDGAVIVAKNYSNIQNNTVNLKFDADDSAKLKPGEWIYVMDWYRNNEFMYNIVDGASFKVVDKG